MMCPRILQPTLPVVSARRISMALYSGVNATSHCTKSGRRETGKNVPLKRNIGSIPSPVTVSKSWILRTNVVAQITIEQKQAADKTAAGNASKAHGDKIIGVPVRSPLVRTTTMKTVSYTHLRAHET